jgi:hypothetical protein
MGEAPLLTALPWRLLLLLLPLLLLLLLLLLPPLLRLPPALLLLLKCPLASMSTTEGLPPFLLPEL